MSAEMLQATTEVAETPIDHLKAEIAIISTRVMPASGDDRHEKQGV